MIAAATNTGTSHSVSAEHGQARVIGRESNRSPLSLEYSVYSAIDSDNIAVEIAADALRISDIAMQPSLHQYACLMVVEALRNINSNHLIVLDLAVIARGNNQDVLSRKVLKEAQRKVYLLNVSIPRHCIYEQVRRSLHRLAAL